MLPADGGCSLLLARGAITARALNIHQLSNAQGPFREFLKADRFIIVSVNFLNVKSLTYVNITPFSYLEASRMKLFR